MEPVKWKLQKWSLSWVKHGEGDTKQNFHQKIEHSHFLLISSDEERRGLTHCLTII